MTKLNILVVEDKDANIQAAREMLKAHNLTVVSGFDQASQALKAKYNYEEAKTMIEKELPEGLTCKIVESDEQEGQKRFQILDKEGRNTTQYSLYALVDKALEAKAYAPFDVVLTDVMFPKGGDECMSREGAELARRQGEMPYGPIVALRALQLGIKKVGILTSGDHHSDPFIFAFDALNGFTIGDTKVICSNRMEVGWDTKAKAIVDTQNMPWAEKEPKLNSGELAYAKDWQGLLAKLMA